MNDQRILRPLKMTLFTFHSANTIVISFLPLLLAYRGLKDLEIGWVLAVGPGISIISQPLFGYLSDRYKTVKKVLLFATIGLIISSFFFFQLETLSALLFTALIFHFFSSSMGPLSDSLAQRTAKKTGVTFGSIRTFGSFGFAISSLLIGFYIDWVGIKYLFIPYLTLAILLLLFIFKIQDIEVEQKKVLYSDIVKLLKTKQFTLFLLVMLSITLTHRTNDSFMGLYIIEMGGTDQLVGLAWFLGVLGEALVFMFSSLWYRKMHPLIFMVLAAWVYALRFFAYGITFDPYVLVSMQILHGLSFSVFYVASFDYISRLIPDHMQSTGHLIYMTVFFGVSGIIGSLGGGYMLNMLGGSVLYITLGSVAVFGSLLLLVFRFFYRT